MKNELSIYKPFSLTSDLFNDTFSKFLYDCDFENFNFSNKSMDLIEDETNYKLIMDIPGVNTNDLNVTIENGLLTIQAERKINEEFKNKVSRKRYGKITKSVFLPEGANLDKINADLKDGVLTITIDKLEETLPKKIEVQINKSE